MAVKGGYAINAPSYPTPQEEVIATRKAAFIDMYSKAHSANGSKVSFIRQLRTKFKTHTTVGSLICRKRLIDPLMSLAVVGWANTENPSMEE